uniref:MARVEL domain-containing protein n=1 Tax=Panagrellus redivivus TaxID=6233 RepID=A0A7E5A0E8_PANRE
MVEIDKEFPKSYPFGVLKTLHWALPFALLITLYVGTFQFGGVGFVLFSAWNAFFYSILTWFCYLFGFNKKVFNVGNAYLFIPFALMDFLVSIFFLLFFGISTLICIICIFESFKYRFTVILTYLFATAFSLGAAAAFGYFAILVYRACPNGQIRNLASLVIEGTTTATRPPADGPGEPGRPVV